jgi:Fuc2NAc and GlcNAc transferase
VPTFLLLLAGAVLAAVLTGMMRAYALRAELLDRPNERSSHAVPTPRGGGVAICVSFLGLTLVPAAFGAVPAPLLWALLGAIPVAAVGWLDDRGHVQARWRFIAHTVAALWALWVFGGIPPVPILGTSYDLGWFGLALCTAYLVWMVNLCNFMDGIDAIAGVEAITVALGGALTWWLATGTPQWYLPALFAACVAGFLAWNWPPARIFMGDVGIIGFVLAVFSLWAAQEATQVFWCWFVLLGCFMVDATTTLVRRVRRGESFHLAHRSHAYQYASRRHGSHGVVSLAVATINVAWLLPIAVLVALRLLDGVLGALIAYAPLVAMAFRYKAGDRAAQVE